MESRRAELLLVQATLAAVIITAVIFSVEHHVVKPVWNSKREKYFALRLDIKYKCQIINHQH